MGVAPAQAKARRTKQSVNHTHVRGQPPMEGEPRVAPPGETTESALVHELGQQVVPPEVAVENSGPLSLVETLLEQHESVANGTGVSVDGDRIVPEASNIGARRSFFVLIVTLPPRSSWSGC